MLRNLSYPDLVSLLHTVFRLRETEKTLTFLIDLPTDRAPDTAEWLDRRRIAIEWFVTLEDQSRQLPFSGIRFCAYDNVGSNNNDLPEQVMLVDGWSKGERLASTPSVDLQEVLAASGVVLSFTEFSATAPLKNLARRLNFRGATLPGFSRTMIPALRLDYEAVHRRVLILKERMDRAIEATVKLNTGSRECITRIDLRFRSAHASGGLIREQGTVANLPSGEAYIAPFDDPREPSRTEGLLPVQFGDEIVLFRIENNRAVEVITPGKQSLKQRHLLENEPAYGNIAELGIGVLAEWGVTAVGSSLLDEKLGLHIAFGRSDHFGGFTGPSAFRRRQEVTHIDWVYVPSLQPRIRVSNVTFRYDGDAEEAIIEDGKIVV